MGRGWVRSRSRSRGRGWGGGKGRVGGKGWGRSRGRVWVMGRGWFLIIRRFYEQSWIAP